MDHLRRQFSSEAFNPPALTPSLVQLLIFILIPIFALSLLGIFSRPVGSLASVWPANALLLGIMARQPGFTRPAGWLAAFSGYLLADWITGSSWDKNLLLNLGNLLGVAGGLALVRLLPGGLFPITQKLGILRLIGVALIASLSASIAGIFVYPYFWNGTPLEGAIFWSVSEFVNYIAFLPLVLTAPGSMQEFRSSYRNRRQADHSMLYDLLPFIAFVLLCILVSVVDGPGSLAIPIVALLWCGLTYSLFTTAVLTLIYCFWTLLFVAQGYISAYAHLVSWDNLMSLRLSVSMIALAPLMNAIMAHKRLQQIDKLTYLASHDGLTGALNRGGFYKAISDQVRRKKPHSFAFMMIDLDHFKQINDTRGHAAGDKVLATFVSRVQEKLPSNAILGRLGGEEFAVLLWNLPVSDYHRCAEAIRYSLEEEIKLDLNSDASVKASVSIGMIHGSLDEESNCDFELITGEADRALYQAKEQGRNCVVEVSCSF
ncbi:GGDEF domain-containing protein [Oceanospirillum sanctuarii]|uniref:GGDEF domain-containing protein n=1 Tax=Oceanospirillum sanctuarii TaxID=1434821 RepID=UPI001594C632|nr:GGDEF domain-containing protein [Oceanospirillum sanctuarii]